MQVFNTDDLYTVETQLKDLSQIASIEENVTQVCDCSFLYFYRNLFPQFVTTLYQTSLDSAMSHTQLVLSAFSDPDRILKHVRHVERDPVSSLTPCMAGYHKFVLNVMKEEYAGPICELIETDLRLATSGSKGVDQFLRKFIASPPLYLCQTRFCVKEEVERHLEKRIYEYCALNLNDCNTYNEMRAIATERYGLHLTEPFLPDGSLDQGIDFIDLLRELDCEYRHVYSHDTLLKYLSLTTSLIYSNLQHSHPNTITISLINPLLKEDLNVELNISLQ